MKTIKTIWFILALTIVGLGLTACHEDEYESRLKLLIINDVTVSSSAQTDTQTFRNEDMSNYAVSSSDETWCHPVIKKETCQIITTIDENTTYDLREAVVTITDTKDGKSSRTFKVTQAQKDALLINKEHAHFTNIPTSGGQVTIEVKTNVPYTVKIDEANDDWISLASNAASTRGLESYHVVLDIAKNESGAGRTGYVYIINNKNTDEAIKIIIDQLFDAFLTVDPTSLSIDELGGTVKTTVRSNIVYDVYSQADWIKRGTLETVDDETTIETFRVEPFTEKKKSRTGYVLIENAAWDDKQVTVAITQTRALYIEESEIAVNVGDRLAVELYNAAGDDNVTWTSSNEKVATVTKDGTVVGVADGTATVTVTSADGKHTDTVRVIVNVASEAKLNDSWSKVTSDGLVNSVTITLTNADTREIYLKSGTFYRVTVDGEETTTENIGNDSGNVYMKAGETHTVSFSGIAPKEPSATATYSYYMEWEYTVDSKAFTYKAIEK